MIRHTQSSLDRDTLATPSTLWRTPDVTIARLTLESYFRSGWMWTEFVLVLVFFAALFFPFQEDVPYFYGTSTWDLSAIALLGAAIMVRQATSARTYVLLARLDSRGGYSRGLMLASAALRIPIFLFMLLLVLLAHRLINPTVNKMLIGAIGLLPITILVSVLAVALSSPISTRLTRILFLTWITLVLFSLSPVFMVSSTILNTLEIARTPLWPITACYQMSVSGTISMTGVIGIFLVGVYIVILALVAGKWLEGRELLLF